MTGMMPPPAPPSAPPSLPPRPPMGRPAGVNVGGGSSMGRALFAFCGGLGGAYYGFYLQSKYMEERRVFVLVENEARRRLQEEKDATATSMASP